MTTHLVAMGGGGFSMNDGASALDRYVLDLAGRARPNVCFVPTASGDADGYVDRFRRAFERLDCTTGHLSLFRRTGADLADELADQDVIYVGGGSTANLLALWRLHGLDTALAARAAAGDLVVCGLSAGAVLVRGRHHRLVRARAAPARGRPGLGAGQRLSALRR